MQSILTIKPVAWTGAFFYQVAAVRVTVKRKVTA